MVTPMNDVRVILALALVACRTPTVIIEQITDRPQILEINGPLVIAHKQGAAVVTITVNGGWTETHAVTVGPPKL